MSKSERFKFGEIALPKDFLPPLDDVYETLRDGRQRESTEERDAADSPLNTQALYLNTDHKEYSYCHFRIDPPHNTGETTQTSRRANPPGSYARVFYFENGQFAIESLGDEIDQRVLAVIGGLTGADTENAYEFYEPTVAQSTKRDHVPVLGTVPTANREHSSDSRPETPIAGAMDPWNGTKRSHQTADVVDEAAETMQLLGPDARDNDSVDGFTSGTVVATWSEKDWPDEAVIEQRAETIREKIIPHLRPHT